MLCASGLCFQFEAQYMLFYYYFLYCKFKFLNLSFFYIIYLFYLSYTAIRTIELEIAVEEDDDCILDPELDEIPPSCEDVTNEFILAVGAE